MSALCHVQIYPVDGAIFRGFFSIKGSKFLLALEDDAGEMHDGGEWSTVAEADEWARLMIADLRTPETVGDPLAKYRGEKYSLLATLDSVGHEWAVTAGCNKSGRYEDTGLRFRTQAEARSAIDAV